MKGDAVLGEMLAAIDEAFDRKSWHGTNLRGSLRSLTVDQGSWRPSPGRHNIWEILVHAAYWKYVVRRALTGEKRGSFPYKGSNWFARDARDPVGWQRDLELLAREHRQLRQAVAGLDPRRLEKRPGRRFSYAGLIRGVAAHDLYHAGQIQLLKRMQKGI